MNSVRHWVKRVPGTRVRVHERFLPEVAWSRALAVPQFSRSSARLLKGRCQALSWLDAELARRSRRTGAVCELSGSDSVALVSRFRSATGTLQQCEVLGDRLLATPVVLCRWQELWQLRVYSILSATGALKQ
ncbi:hypothetical protein NDU88_004642 [Pleurodeles waltl]|uniref:Uncharacterized protein n=1 Tax=Pleurodeles waltl TaxID=8319 RepID=A0AAV7LKD8_PLEWA|nr:hypothetical protein NDU88_004642 [Pleurodeles waltl]